MTARVNGRTALTRDDVLGIVAEALGLYHGEAESAAIAETVVADLEAEGVQHEGWGA
ncbi:hypothetical protein [Xylanimonas oleitrophica]|uniref:hypothetical protein n=1 Tax=Xylanimonas oleitrophica TaxID=2607479 RepID=UPI0015D088F8|nr:hypothetical protein [Xylanimonas oleitrophica]